MMELVKAADRFTMDAGWLLARWHFSFDHYRDPNNMGFGPLRVFNHDVIQPGQGFGMHPHRDMEIVTFVIRGIVEHKDSTGGHGFIQPGEVQYMTAGTGVFHSEFNASKYEDVELLQMWILPDKKGKTPTYEQKEFGVEERTGKLLPVMSVNEGTSTFYVSRLEPGQPVAHPLGADRRAYVFVIDGAPALNGQALAKNDSVKVSGESELRFESSEPAEVLFIDLP